MSDFVFPDRRLFPINTPEDVTNAIGAFKVFKDEISYSEFVFRLVNVARKKGEPFLNALPSKLKKYAGLKRENRPESNENIVSHKKKPSRFIRYEDEDRE